MSKKIKKAQKAKNRAAKRAKRDANRAQYQTWARDGVNQKSVRFKRKKKKPITKSHPQGECGNIGCRKCNPAPYNLPPGFTEENRQKGVSGSPK